MLKNGFQGVDSIVREVVYKVIDGVKSEVGMVIMVPTNNGYHLGVSKYNRNREIADHIPFSQATGYGLAYQASEGDIIITLPDLITKGGVTFRSKDLAEKIFQLCQLSIPINVEIASATKHLLHLMHLNLHTQLENIRLRYDLKNISRNHTQLHKKIKKTARKYQ